MPRRTVAPKCHIRQLWRIAPWGGPVVIGRTPRRAVGIGREQIRLLSWCDWTSPKKRECQTVRWKVTALRLQSDRALPVWLLDRAWKDRTSCRRPVQDCGCFPLTPAGNRIHFCDRRWEVAGWPESGAEFSDRTSRYWQSVGRAKCCAFSLQRVSHPTEHILQQGASLLRTLPQLRHRTHRRRRRDQFMSTQKGKGADDYRFKQQDDRDSFRPRHRDCQRVGRSRDSTGHLA